MSNSNNNNSILFKKQLSIVDLIPEQAKTEDRVSRDDVPAHPTANRGAQNTSFGEQEMFLDYLKCTFPFHSFQEVVDSETGEVVQFFEPNFVQILEIFGEMEDMGKSVARGYTHSARLGCGGIVSWDPDRPEQKVLVSLGGQALAELGIPPLELLDTLDRGGASFTRIDWAKDDRAESGQGLLDLEEILRVVQAGEVCTRWKNFEVIYGGKIGKPERLGLTLYFGNRVSESFMRMYDKAAQEGLDEHWVRVELETKGRKARKMASEVLDIYRNGGEEAICTVADYILGVIRGLFDIKIPAEDTNKSRWETVDYWLEFLGDVSQMSIGLPKIELTLERAKEWVGKMLAPTLSMIDNLDRPWLTQVLEDAFLSLKKHHKRKFERWRVEFGESVVAQIGKLQQDLAAVAGGV